MAVIKPFKAIRPKKDLVAQVASLPYDVFTKKEARQAVKDNPLTFLKIARSETAFPEDVDMYSDKVYEKARNLLDGEIAKGVLVQEKKECYYVYRLTMNGRSQTGLVACFSVDDDIRRFLSTESYRDDRYDPVDLFLPVRKFLRKICRLKNLLILDQLFPFLDILNEDRFLFFCHLLFSVGNTGISSEYVVCI